MISQEVQFKYDGPIFDAHTHVVDLDHLDIQFKIGERYGVKKSLLIVHGDSIDPIERRYPGKFIYAKYFSGWLLMGGDVEAAIASAKNMKDEGYSVAKMHFAPFWRDRLGLNKILAVDNEIFDPLFEIFEEMNIPILIHICDPDTYYAKRYSAAEYGTKDEHIAQFEHRLEKSPNVRFQVAHFGAQPEPHRLDNLGRMLRRYSNLYVDTGSARWMARELSRDAERSAKFVTTFSDRILFGSDCVSRTDDVSYYEGRYYAERVLWETDVRHVPLPFVDTDTVDTGGTFINGLDLSETVLSRIYWDNAERLYRI